MSGSSSSTLRVPAHTIRNENNESYFILSEDITKGIPEMKIPMVKMMQSIEDFALKQISHAVSGIDDERRAFAIGRIRAEIGRHVCVVTRPEGKDEDSEDDAPQGTK
ncbi:hypothetical protein HD806DRAFT_177027 [Xylariaceae sp. AK1471]|nr:hypothetical protein HD806DRAFT_177027 [Xylariaceae sp. AK1471]